MRELPERWIERITSQGQLTETNDSLACQNDDDHSEVVRKGHSEKNENNETINRMFTRGHREERCYD